MAAAATIASAQPALEFTGERTTTTARVARIVGKTDPGAQARINGIDAKVYKTGCFGAEVELNEGDNAIVLEATKDGLTTTKTITMTRTAPEHKPKHEPVMHDVMFNVLTLKGAFLQYGNGTDRLGGSKMSYIDEDIPLKVVGDYANLYRVKLANNRFAFIQKELVKMDLAAEVKTVNTSSISYGAHNNVDNVEIYLPCRLPYYTWTQLDPTTINVDLYGAMCNSNWISQHGELGMIDYIDFRQVESDVMRVVIKLKKKFAWGYSVNYRNNTLVVSVKHAPASLALKNLTIGLDAGHGGEYPGAVGNSGLQEKVVNLQLVNLVKEMLEAKGAKVVLTRSEDVNMEMWQRKQIFLENKVDIAFSIHNNAGGSPLVDQGSSTYYKHIVNRPLAATMLKHLTGIGLTDSGLTGNFNFSLNMPIEYPNTLLEVLYMSSLPDEEKLSDAAWRKKIAQAIVAGIEDYLNQAKQDK